MPPQDDSKVFFNKKFLISIILHILHGFILEKSKLYFPYTVGRNIIFIKTDLYKFYLSITFIFLGMPYLLSKIPVNNYFSARLSVINRYQNRNPLDIQLGSYLLGISMIFTGFCPSYLPVYMALSPVLFLYSIAASYTAFILYHVFGRIILNRTHVGAINNAGNTSVAIPNEKRDINSLGRVLVISICIIILLVFEASEQSIPTGHTSNELLDLIYNGDYLPPGLSGLLCGLINFMLIFFCDEYQTLTSEWLINIFYYTSDFTFDRTNINGQLCVEQIFKVLSMAFGVRLSLFMSKRREIPNIDWLFYSLMGCGSFIGAFSISLTSATFSDHIYLVNGFMEIVSSDVIICTIGAAWITLYVSKLIGLSNLR